MKRIILTIALICAGITMSDASVPSDEAADTDWNKLAVEGVSREFVQRTIR